MASRASRSSGLISIHAPPRGATRLRELYIYTNLFQFTPLREGRLDTIQDCIRKVQISIHAPPRGATFPAVRPLYTNFISIHAPPRGATWQSGEKHHRRHHFNSRPSARGDYKRKGKAPPNRNFNSRPSARGDQSLPHHVGLAGHISIHAPPRGATRRRSRDGSTVLFQFTPLREGRRNGKAAASTMADFNSRPSARGDAFLSIPTASKRISIHAPPRGATLAQGHDWLHG